jgi:hypothetical protein
VALTFEVGAAVAPILVQPILPDAEEFGLLMPLRQDDDVDPDQRCPVCKRLLAAGAPCPDHGRPERPDDGSVGAAVNRLKGALAETGTTMTVQVGDGRPVSVVPPLEWKPGHRGSTEAALPDGGFFRISKRGDGFGLARVKAGKKGLSLISGPGAIGEFTYEEDAKKRAQQLATEDATNAFLKNRGAGDLVKGELAGDAVARKKGGRRG